MGVLARGGSRTQGSFVLFYKREREKLEHILNADGKEPIERMGCVLWERERVIDG